MSEFEFQRFVTIGQHLPTGSAIHGLDARTRLIAGALLLVAISTTPSLIGLGIAIATLLLLCAMARVPVGYALKGILAPLPFILILVAIQVLFGPGGDTQAWLTFGPIRVSPTTIANGLKILLRFPALILAITLFSACTATTEAVRGLDALMRPLARLGLPTQDVVLMVQVTLRFLPLLAREAERIAKSQASRGAEWGTGRTGVLRRVRQALPLLVPLFLVSLQRAEALALAMEARGYAGQTARTSLVALRFRRGDALALLLTAALCVAVFLL